MRSFFAVDAPLPGGVFVGAGDVNGDGRTDLIAAAGTIGFGSGPPVKVFDGRDNRELQGFFAFDAAFMGGARVAAVDGNGDGRDDLLVGAGPMEGRTSVGWMW